MEKEYSYDEAFAEIFEQIALPYAEDDEISVQHLARIDQFPSPFMSQADGDAGDNRISEDNDLMLLHAAACANEPDVTRVTSSSQAHLSAQFNNKSLQNTSFPTVVPTTSATEYSWSSVQSLDHSTQPFLFNCKSGTMAIPSSDLELSSPYPISTTFNSSQAPSSSSGSSTIDENGPELPEYDLLRTSKSLGSRKLIRSRPQHGPDSLAFCGQWVGRTPGDGSDHSRERPSTNLHTFGNLTASNSCPSFSTLQTSPRTLTQLQTVDENTFSNFMPLKAVKIPDPRDQGSTAISLDYRDQSWQGRSDEFNGWTPYVQYADFPGVKDMLQDMRSHPEECMPDRATIFSSHEQVKEWREAERQKACRSGVGQNLNELPRTPDEKAAIVKLLFKAFKSTIAQKSNPNVRRPFEEQTHSNAHVEAVCWELLELAIQRSEGGELSYAYNPTRGTKSASDRGLSFANRIDSLIQSLLFEKSVCNNLLKVPKLMETVDMPDYTGKRTANNRHLNRQKATISRLGKQKLKELNLEDTSDAQTPQSTATDTTLVSTKRARGVVDGDESEPSEQMPAKKHSPERSGFCTSYPNLGSQIQASPSPAHDSELKSPAQPFVGPSTTRTVHTSMEPFNFEGMPPPNFNNYNPQLPVFPQSSIRQTMDLASHGAQFDCAADFDDPFQHIASRSVRDPAPL